MAGEAALTRSMLVRFQPPEPHSSVAKWQGARLLIGILQVRFLPLELSVRASSEGHRLQNGEARCDSASDLGPIEHQLVRRTLNPENRGQHSVGSLHRPVRLAARMRRFQCCEAGSTPARDAIVFSSGRSSVGRALGPEPRGRRFEPCCPDKSAFRPTARTLARLARDEGSNPSGRTITVLVAQRSERAAVNREMSVRFRSITPSIARRRLW